MKIELMWPQEDEYPFTIIDKSGHFRKYSGRELPDEDVVEFCKRKFEFDVEDDTSFDINWISMMPYCGIIVVTLLFLLTIVSFILSKKRKYEVLLLENFGNELNPRFSIRKIKTDALNNRPERTKEDLRELLYYIRCLAVGIASSYLFDEFYTAYS